MQGAHSPGAEEPWAGDPGLLCDNTGPMTTLGWKPQQGQGHGRGTACLTAKLGSPAPRREPPIAKRPSEQTRVRTRIRKQGSRKWSEERPRRKITKVTSTFPSPETTGDSPPTPPHPTPAPKSREGTGLSGKKQDSREREMMGAGATGEQGGADGDSAERPPRKASPGSLKYNIVHKQAATETTVIKHTHGHGTGGGTRPRAAGWERRVLAAA